MKVIGEAGRDTLICEVSRTEVEKFMNLYYGKMKKIEVGQEIDLGRGHDFAGDIETAFRNTQEFVNANSKIIRAIMDGLTVVSNMGDVSEGKS